MENVKNGTARRRYVNPKTDIGFKMIFGQKELMKSFLEALFRKEIEDLEYLQQEQIPDFSNLKTCVFDIYCRAKDGRHFIIEMQVAFNINFKDRMLYYICKAVTGQVRRGDDWRFCPVYGIFFTDFIVDRKEMGVPEGMSVASGESSKEFIRSVSLRYDDTYEKFHDKINMIFIEMPKFAKREEECESMLDKWILNVTNMAKNKHIAFAENEEIFRKLSESSIMDHLSPEAQLAHEMYLDNLLQFKWAYEDMEKMEEMAMERGLARGMEKGMAEGLEKGMAEGLEKGMAEGLEKGMEKGMEKGKMEMAIQTARNFKALGIDNETIAKGTGLSIAEIESL